MTSYSGAAREQAMKRQELLLRAYSKQISWIEAADTSGDELFISADTHCSAV